jgi:adenine-specific DNA-methyltransferase
VIDLNGKSEKELKDIIQSQDRLLSKPSTITYNEKYNTSLKNKVITLVKDENKSIDGGMKHLLLEGDNLHACKALNYTHKDKIGLIIYDGPYNTGNDDFVYADSFVKKDDTDRESKWIAYSYERIKECRDLLAKDGFIVVHIDDNELGNMTAIMNKEFGKENHVTTHVWRKKATNGGGTSKGFDIVSQHEYLLVYAKNKEMCSVHGVEGDSNQFTFTDGKRRYHTNSPLQLTGHSTYSASLDYEIESPSGKKIKPRDCYGEKVRAQIDARQTQRTWRYSKEQFEKLNKNGDIIWKKDKPFIKTYMNTPDGQLKNMTSIIDDSDCFTTNDDNIEKIFGVRDVYPHPKPLELLKKYVLPLFSNADSLILDLFGGSGTVAHAAIELNENDGGTRKVITCQNNTELENFTCEKITQKRIEYAIDNSSKDNGLIYYKIICDDFDFTNESKSKFSDTYRHNLVNMIAMKEDCFEIKEEEEYFLLSGNVAKTIIAKSNFVKILPLLQMFGDPKIYMDFTDEYDGFVSYQFIDGIYTHMEKLV